VTLINSSWKLNDEKHLFILFFESNIVLINLILLGIINAQYLLNKKGDIFLLLRNNQKIIAFLFLAHEILSI
jgi:hypothetical protein